ncbi:DUF4810 domain-containing protein [Achromobacter seleniivolatilans]|uniref:DUF4810 domain-containing protein n=1 Tax=Achromobacter seleniivolatilans TaxID=3047478 RepID=A0ABY9LWJ5_9BURK|nr:DUF4810 domain-containing protein [Achromobacter sp. R39]WMD18961.1 DUF4810 domain-containing protein [Achromobacter sp. R39]
MNHQSNSFARAGRGLAIVAVAVLLSACAQPRAKPLYSWQAYQPSVYAYLQDDGADSAVQAQALEKNIETARSANVELPPGFRAHLGMLYLKMGDGDKAVEQLQGEKVAFPESTQFMDFLMRNVGKAPAQPSASAPADESASATKPESANAAVSKKGS